MRTICAIYYSYFSRKKFPRKNYELIISADTPPTNVSKHILPKFNKTIPRKKKKDKTKRGKIRAASRSDSNDHGGTAALFVRSRAARNAVSNFD